MWAAARPNRWQMAGEDVFVEGVEQKAVWLPAAFGGWIIVASFRGLLAARYPTVGSARGLVRLLG